MKWYAPEWKFRAENGGLSRGTYPICIHMEISPRPRDSCPLVYGKIIFQIANPIWILSLVKNDLWHKSAPRNWEGAMIAIKRDFVFVCMNTHTNTRTHTYIDMQNTCTHAVMHILGHSKSIFNILIAFKQIIYRLQSHIFCQHFQHPIDFEMIFPWKKWGFTPMTITLVKSCPIRDST